MFSEAMMRASCSRTLRMAASKVPVALVSRRSLRMSKPTRMSASMWKAFKASPSRSSCALSIHEIAPDCMLASRTTSSRASSGGLTLFSPASMMIEAKACAMRASGRQVMAAGEKA